MRIGIFSIFFLGIVIASAAVQGISDEEVGNAELALFNHTQAYHLGRHLLGVPASKTVEISQPLEWYASHGHLAAGWYMRAYNPSIVRQPKSSEFYVYARVTSYSRCAYRTHVPFHKGTWSRIATCTASSFEEMGSCQLKVTMALAPRQGTCSRVRGVEDIRLFIHRSKVYGIGAYRAGSTACVFRPLLVHFRLSTGSPISYTPILNAEPDPKKHTKNWAFLPHRYPELCDDCVLVVTKPVPLHIGILNIMTAEFTPDVFTHPRDKYLFGNLPFDIRGSSGFIPAHGWFPNYPIAYMALGHFGRGWGGLLYYRHFFFLMQVKTQPNGNIIFKPVARSSPFYWNQGGSMRVGEHSPNWDDRIQFSTGLECLTDQCDSFIVTYGRGDCSGHMVQVERWRVIEMFNFKIPPA